MPPLSTQIARAFAGPCWHGTALGALLADVTASEAATRPAPGVHTIAELAGHIGVWCDVARRRLAGEDASATDAENFAPLDTGSDAQWRAAVRDLGARHDALARAAEPLTGAQLDAPMAGRGHTVREMLHGVIEHTAYHGGQVAMLRALLRGGR
jgi:uncharacterized damage-inducible protein DinB